MSFEELIAAKIDELESSADVKSSSFGAWDHAKLVYLQQVKEQLAQGEDASAVYVQLKNELPHLEEDAEREVAMPTFDFYDEHHYEKICLGKLAACKLAIELYKQSIQI